MNDITALAQRMKAAAEKATPGEWWSDVVESDGEYGEGEDRFSGYHSYAVYVGSESLLDMTNSTAACIHEEWDHDYHMAWDETAKHNAEFIAVASPDNVKALVGALEMAQRQIQAHERAELTWMNALALPDDASRIDILPAIHAEKYALREATKRIASLESRTVIEPKSDYFASLVAMARVSADKAMRKFPQPNYVLLKVAEEAGEVVQAGVHYAEKRMEWQQVEGEIVQLLAMLIRLVTEGDQINGITPPAAGIQVVEGAQTE